MINEDREVMFTLPHRPYLPQPWPFLQQVDPKDI